MVGIHCNIQGKRVPPSIPPSLLDRMAKMELSFAAIRQFAADLKMILAFARKNNVGPKMIAHAHQGMSFAGLAGFRIGDFHGHRALFNRRPGLGVAEHNHEVVILLFPHLGHHGADIVEMGHLP